MQGSVSNSKSSLAKLAFRFVVVIGIVNFFADFSYEGARSINGAFLASLGASSIAVGLTAGFGELIGFGLRSLSGFVADKSHRYWLFAVVGYLINMGAVPAMALAGNWPVAAMLIVAERTGRAIRKPSVETMLSYSAGELGRGWVFGLNEVLDQFGATLGPLVVAWVLLIRGRFTDGYAILLVSAVLCLIIVVIARYLFPTPHEFDKHEAVSFQTKGFQRSYWLFAGAGALTAAGYCDFSLIAFHFQKTESIPLEWIPILYAIAMATAGASALLLGKLMDKLGIRVLVTTVLLGALFAPFAFLGGFSMAVIGMVLWGVGMGAQDSLLKAFLSGIAPRDRLGTAFGVFDTLFGIAWFLGSAAMGFLYSKSVIGVVIFSVLLQVLALPVFAMAAQRDTPSSRRDSR
jgi:MFS family permease